jgi:hypothetical protein
MFLLFAVLQPTVALGQNGPDDAVTVVAEGVAAVGADAARAEDEAIWDAKRNAVEQAAGVFLRSRMVGRDFVGERDEIEGRTQGFIRGWEVVSGSRRIERLDRSGKGRLLRIRVRATVALLPVIHRLSDIADAYNDLERPHLRVCVVTAGAAAPWAATAQTAIVAALQAQGFEVTAESGAEENIVVRLHATPTLRMGDPNAPYDLGQNVAACRAEMTLQAISTVSDEVLFTVRAVGQGESFESDAEAARAAVADAIETGLEASRQPLVDRLLVRWAHEREEGHTVVIRATGLTPAAREWLRKLVEGMRGFCRITGEEASRNGWTMRFVTRLSTRDVRRRLGESDPPTGLTLLNTRGPIIQCAARPSSASLLRGR